MSKSIQSKFPLAVVINILTAFSFGYVCFLGANFYTLGETRKSIILAAIVTFLLIATSLGAKILKQTNRNFKSCFIWEIIFLILFTLITAYFTYFPFSHYFVVSENETEIKSKLNTSITQAENMFAKYETYVNERKVQYENNLNSAILTKDVNDTDFVKYGFVKNSIPYDSQIKNKMRTIGFDLLPSNFKGIKSENSDWLANSRNDVNDWKPIGLVEVIKNLEQNSKKWNAELVKISKIRETGETAEDFKYSLSFNDVITYFTALEKPSTFSIVVAIIGYLLMLLSWFITKRDSRGNGALTTAEYEIVL